MAYSVYTLTDGELGVDETHDNLDDARMMFEFFVGAERSRAARIEDYVETTVHLYDAHESAMIMLAETCVTPNYTPREHGLFGVGVPASESWLQG